VIPYLPDSSIVFSKFTDSLPLVDFKMEEQQPCMNSAHISSAVDDLDNSLYQLNEQAFSWYGIEIPNWDGSWNEGYEQNEGL